MVLRGYLLDLVPASCKSMKLALERARKFVRRGCGSVFKVRARTTRGGGRAHLLDGRGSAGGGGPSPRRWPAA